MRAKQLSRMAARGVGFMAAAALLVACNNPDSGEMTTEGLWTVIQSGGLEALGPAGEAVNVLQAVSSSTKVALVAHLEKRVQSATYDFSANPRDPEVERRLQWYEANLDCLKQNNCAELRRLQAERDKARRPAAAAAPAAPSGAGDHGGGGHSD